MSALRSDSSTPTTTKEWRCPGCNRNYEQAGSMFADLPRARCAACYVRKHGPNAVHGCTGADCEICAIVRDTAVGV